MAEDLIKDIVSPEAIKQLEGLYSALKKNEELITDIVKKTSSLELGNINSLKDIKDALDKQGKAIEEITKKKKEQVSIQSQIDKINAKIINGTKSEALAYEEARQRLLEHNRELARQAKANINAEDSLRKLQAQLAQLNNAYAKLSGADREGIVGQQTLERIKQMEVVVRQTEESMGIFNRNVGNYKKGWDGIGNSVSQLTRELPNFTQSAQLGFLAISNNIPIMVDEIERLKVKNMELNAQGIKTEPVWKSVLKSFASWNTLMMAGVALLTLYGKDIVTWIGGLFKGDEALKKFNATLETQRTMLNSLNEARDKAMDKYVDEATRMELLYRASQDNTRAMSERKAAVDELQKMFPDYFGNLSDETILAGKAAKAYEQLTRDIIASAKARAAEEKIIENQKSILDLDEKIAKQKASTNNAEQILSEARKKRNEAEKQSTPENPTRDLVETGFAVNSATKAYNEQTSALIKLQSQKRGLELANERLAKQTNVKDLIEPTPTSGGGGGKTGGGDNIEDKRLKMEEKLSQAKVDAIKKDYNTNIETINAKYKYEEEKLKTNIEKEIKEAEKLAGTDKKMLQTLNEFKAEKAKELANGLSEIDKNRLEETKKAEYDAAKETAEAKKAASEEGTMANIEATLALLDIQKEEELRKAEEKGIEKQVIEDKYIQLAENAWTKHFEKLTEKEIQAMSDRQSAINDQEAAAQVALANQYANGEINFEEYQEKLTDISYKYNQKRIQIEIDALKKVLESTNLSAEARAEIMGKVSKLEKEMSDETTDNNLKNIKKGNDKRDEQRRIAKNLAKDAFNTIVDFIQQEAEIKAAKIDEEIAKIDEKRNKDIEELNNSVMSEETKAQRIKEINEQADAEKKKLEEEKRKALTQAAIAQKAANVVEATINTAVAATAAFKTGPIIGPILAGMITALGAAQIAMILRQPLPKYKFGTDYHKGGPAVVGDGGKNEYIVTPKGDVYETPNMPTIMDIPRGAQVYPDYASFRDDVKQVDGSDKIVKAIERSKSSVSVNLDSDGIFTISNRGRNKDRYINSRLKYKQ